MKRKGFTLIELLVVIAIIALLMGILMPALARVRALANRVVCGTNLKGIGTSIAVYSNDDFNSRYPRAGMENSLWGETGVLIDPLTGNVLQNDQLRISTSFYLLIREGYAQPDQFVCKGDSGVHQFETFGEPYTNFVDFGGCCSYSYHQPYYSKLPEDGPMTDYSLGPGSDPGLALAGDPTPFLPHLGNKTAAGCQAAPFDDAATDPAPIFILDLNMRNREVEQHGNAITHQKEGQNILFCDNHLKFEKYSFCGVDEDNVYSLWDKSTVPPEIMMGLVDSGPTPPTTSPFMIPRGREDSVLVNE